MDFPTGRLEFADYGGAYQHTCRAQSVHRGGGGIWHTN